MHGMDKKIQNTPNTNTNTKAVWSLLNSETQPGIDEEVKL